MSDQPITADFEFENLIYGSDSMAGVVHRLRRIAPSDAGVLITGEAGVGKTHIAKTLHYNSPRKDKPFVFVAASLTEQETEADLFGHVKNAFSDAISDRPGKFESADGGTLFLDEVGDLPMSSQIKLLRFLEEREITRVGDNKPIKVNVRVLAATNKDLVKEVAAGRFREDLYYRLNVVTVHLDSLSKRRSDIMPLADHFRKLASSRSNKKTKGFSGELRNWLVEYRWPRNIEQLRNVIESLVVMDHDGILGMNDLDPELLLSGVIDEYSGRLDLITSLSESLAERISKYTGKVSLGLPSISDAEADFLSRHSGGELLLTGIETLSDAAAKSLGKYKGILGLSGLRQLSEAAAANLSSHSECILLLEGLEVLPSTAGHLALVKKLAAQEGELKLDNLTTLSVDAAGALASHTGVLSLNGLTTLPDTLAAALARHEGTLSLNGLVTLTEDAAQSLRQHRGAIHLEGLKVLSEAAEESLAQHAEIISPEFDFRVDPFAGMKIDETIIGSILEANRSSP